MLWDFLPAQAGEEVGRFQLPLDATCGDLKERIEVTWPRKRHHGARFIRDQGFTAVHSMCSLLTWVQRDGSSSTSSGILVLRPPEIPRAPFWHELVLHSSMSIGIYTPWNYHGSGWFQGVYNIHGLIVFMNQRTACCQEGQDAQRLLIQSVLHDIANLAGQNRLDLNGTRQCHCCANRLGVFLPAPPSRLR